MTNTIIERTAAEPAIRRAMVRFTAGARAGNVDEMMSIYAPDAILMAPNMPAFRGRDAIRAFWSGFLAAGPVDALLETESVRESGDIAAENGRFTMTTPMRDEGKYLVVWQCIDGEWLAILDAFNSDLPAAG